MTIREIVLKDTNDFIKLADQLGYKIDAAYIEERINSKDDVEAVYVAAEASGIIGWIDCRISRTYYSRPYGEIVGFVVDEKVRGRGLGVKLLRRAELWMKEKGAERAVVHSNLIRERAHKFYFNNEYEFVKKSMVFRKTL